MKYQRLGTEIGALVDRKSEMYGDSIATSGAALRLLYPDGISPAQYDDVLLFARMWDKHQRKATGNPACEESPYVDLAGYALRGVGFAQRKKENEAPCPGSVSDPDASSESKESSPASAAQPARTPTTTNASASSASATSRRLAPWSPHTTAAPAPTVREGATPSADDRVKAEVDHLFEKYQFAHEAGVCCNCLCTVKEPHVLMFSCQEVPFPPRVVFVCRDFRCTDAICAEVKRVSSQLP